MATQSEWPRPWTSIGLSPKFRWSRGAFPWKDRRLQVVIDGWRQKYNQRQPHSALGLTSSVFGAGFT